MSESQLTFDKIKALIEMDDVEQREQLIDRIVMKYIDQLDMTLGRMAAENDIKKVIGFARDFYKHNLRDILWVFVLASKPKHRGRMGDIFKRIQDLLEKYSKKEKKR